MPPLLKQPCFLKVLPGHRAAVIAPRGVICGFVRAANQPVDHVDGVLRQLIAPGFRALICGRSLPLLLSLSGTCLWFCFILPFVYPFFPQTGLFTRTDCSEITGGCLSTLMPPVLCSARTSRVVAEQRNTTSGEGSLCRHESFTEESV